MPPLPPLLLTRPAAACARFAGAWREAMGCAAPVVISPVVEIVARPGAADPAGYAGVVFASENAVAALGAAPRPLVAWCVGDRTAEAAAEAGYDARSADGDAGALVALIAASGADGPLLFARGRESRGDVGARLSQVGIRCDEAVVYDQRDVPLSGEALGLLAGTGRVLVPLFSANSARRLARCLDGADVRARLRIAAISPAVAAAWTGPSAEAMRIAERPGATAMIGALRALAALP